MAAKPEAVFSGMGHEGNPKAENRKKPEIRNPSRSTLRSSARANSDLGRRATEDGSASERRARVGPTSRSCGRSRWTGPPLRASNFGFLSDFGLRISDLAAVMPAVYFVVPTASSGLNRT
jgi:hypothetical protein